DVGGGVAGEREGRGAVGPAIAGLELVAPGVQPGPPRPAHGEPEVALGLAGHDLARSPVGGASAVALHVAPEPDADGWPGGAAQPLGVEGLRAEPADLG